MKAWKQTKQGQILNYLAKADLESGEIVIHEGSENDAVTSAVDASAIYAGVVESPKGALTGEKVDVQSSGVAKVQAGAAIAAGETVIANASGLAIPGVAGYILGVAIESCAAPSGGNKSYVSVQLEIHKA
jgi:hypothetical protein